MGPTAALVLGGVVIAAGASFFFALAESALFALGKWRARQLAENSPERGKLVLQLLEHPSELLATIVLGNTVANLCVVALALGAALRGDWPMWGTLIGIPLMVLVGCEMLPKTLAVRAPEQWSLRIARPMRLIHGTAGGFRGGMERFNNRLLRVFLPKSALNHPSLSDEEYEELLELAFQQGTLAASEKEIILQIIRLDRETAKDVMKPRAQMAAISDESTLEEMIAAGREHKHRRLPIYDETPDTIVGVLNAYELLLDPTMDLADAIDFPSFVPESMNLLQLLKSLQQQQRGVAIVLDEFGGTAGLVTIEDILEEVVGEILGEEEAEDYVMERLGPGRWRVGGTMPVDDFRSEFPGLGEVQEVNTMGGLLVSKLEVVPGRGEAVVFRGLKLTARVVDERRVHELLVEKVKRK